MKPVANKRVKVKKTQRRGKQENDIHHDGKCDKKCDRKRWSDGNGWSCDGKW